MAVNIHLKGRTWSIPPARIRALRVGVVAWMLLAVAGWIAAGAAWTVAVREQQAAGRMASAAGPTVIIDGRRLVAPFRVVAVGDPTLLRNVVMTRGGFADRMRDGGLGVQVIPRPQVTVPASDGGASVER